MHSHTDTDTQPHYHNHTTTHSHSHNHRGHGTTHSAHARARTRWNITKMHAWSVFSGSAHRVKCAPTTPPRVAVNTTQQSTQWPTPLPGLLIHATQNSHTTQQYVANAGSEYTKLCVAPTTSEGRARHTATATQPHKPQPQSHSHSHSHSHTATATATATATVTQPQPQPQPQPHSHTHSQHPCETNARSQPTGRGG